MDRPADVMTGYSEKTRVVDALMRGRFQRNQIRAQLFDSWQLIRV